MSDISQGATVARRELRAAERRATAAEAKAASAQSRQREAEVRADAADRRAERLEAALERIGERLDGIERRLERRAPVTAQKAVVAVPESRVDGSGQFLLHGMQAIADFLGVNRRVAYHMAEAKQIPTPKMGATVCATRPALAAWLDARALTLRTIMCEPSCVSHKLVRTWVHRSRDGR